MISNLVTLKGTKDGLLITVGEGEWEEILRDLAAQLDRPRASEFFRGARARLDAGDRMMTEVEIGELARLLEAHAMQLELQPPPPPPPRRRSKTTGRAAQANADAKREQELWQEAALVRRTVRSGQIIRYPGHVVVHGDVNPGAEIVAGGDVIVWGKLRGLVHAGASGEDTAVVAALELAPMQLRIGAFIARAPDERGKGEPRTVSLRRILQDRAKSVRGPEVARVRDGRIVIESWKSNKE